ncbi:hypothetical protein C8R45DRAFT_1041299, partial [Mycena sanguinolenta]
MCCTGAANPTAGTSAARTISPSRASASWTSPPCPRTGRRACLMCGFCSGMSVIVLVRVHLLFPLSASADHVPLTSIHVSVYLGFTSFIYVFLWRSYFSCVMLMPSHLENCDPDLIRAK